MKNASAWPIMGSLILTLVIQPNSPEELAELLAGAASKRETIRLLGQGTKDGMAGPLTPTDAVIGTVGMNRLLRYEPRDLTVSVEAGMLWRDFNGMLAEHRQMAPLDPPFADRATVGGVIAANSSGPRRRLYGTARDLVIGMTFATLEGKLIQTGGMVVKNVAGLDMGKLMIGSFGTLAAIASVNFRLHPLPLAARTFRWRRTTCAEAITVRDGILRSVLQPMAVDLLKDAEGYELLVEAGGSIAVLDRYSRDLAGAVEVEDGERRWREIREFTPAWLGRNPSGLVVRVSATLSEVGAVMDSLPAPAVARSATGVCYGYFTDPRRALEWTTRHGARRAVIEFAPRQFRETAELWPAPGTDFAIMEKVKAMFDPHGLLNRKRLYGRI